MIQLGFITQLVAVTATVIILIAFYIFRGFLSRVGGVLADRFLSSIFEMKDERQFTGSPIENALVERINDINPQRELEIVYIDYAYEEGGSLILEYKSVAEGWPESRQEVENVAYAFASIIKDFTYPCGELAVNILNETGISIGSYNIQRDLAEAFNSGTIENHEYVRRIMNTYNQH